MTSRTAVALSGMLLAVSTSVGCAGLRPYQGPVRAEQAERAHRATAALDEEAFELARADLLALASDCRSGRHGRRALLLLAAAELDTGNLTGSPRLAATAAARYLQLPDASPEEVPLARALYRLGTDLGGGEPPTEVADTLPALASRFDTCDPDAVPASAPPLPGTPAPRSARMAVLREELGARTDSLARVRAELAASERLIAELNAEIERIRELLKSGVPGHPARDRK